MVRFFSREWLGRTRFQVKRLRPLAGFQWVTARSTKIEDTRPDSAWPEVTRKKKNPPLQAARRERGIFQVPYAEGECLELLLESRGDVTYRQRHIQKSFIPTTFSSIKIYVRIFITAWSSLLETLCKYWKPKQQLAESGISSSIYLPGD